MRTTWKERSLRKQRTQTDMISKRSPFVTDRFRPGVALLDEEIVLSTLQPERFLISHLFFTFPCYCIFDGEIPAISGYRAALRGTTQVQSHRALSSQSVATRDFRCAEGWLGWTAVSPKTSYPDVIRRIIHTCYALLLSKVNTDHTANAINPSVRVLTIHLWHLSPREQSAD